MGKMIVDNDDNITTNSNNSPSPAATTTTLSLAATTTTLSLAGFASFVADVRLMWGNCGVYNAPDSHIVHQVQCAFNTP